MVCSVTVELSAVSAVLCSVHYTHTVQCTLHTYSAVYITHIQCSVHYTHTVQCKLHTYAEFCFMTVEGVKQTVGIGQLIEL